MCDAFAEPLTFSNLCPRYFRFDFFLNFGWRFYSLKPQNATSCEGNWYVQSCSLVYTQSGLIFAGEVKFTSTLSRIKGELLRSQSFFKLPFQTCRKSYTSSFRISVGSCQKLGLEASMRQVYLPRSRPLELPRHVEQRIERSGYGNVSSTFWFVWAIVSYT